MTTALNENSRPGLPEPHAYASHVAKVLAAKQAKHARRRRMGLYALAAIVILAALLTLPSFISASICISLPILVLAAILSSLWRDSREYNKDHDLP